MRCTWARQKHLSTADGTVIGSNGTNCSSGLDSKNKGDDQALYAHYRKYHVAEIENGLELAEAYRVIFLENPLLANLDCAESFWIGKIPATINIQKTFLPTINSTFKKQ